MPNITTPHTAWRPDTLASGVVHACSPPLEGRHLRHLLDDTVARMPDDVTLEGLAKLHAMLIAVEETDAILYDLMRA